MRSLLCRLSIEHHRIAVLHLRLCLRCGLWSCLLRLSVREELGTRHTTSHVRVRRGCRSRRVRRDVSRIADGSVSSLRCQPLVKHLLSFFIRSRKVFLLIFVEVNALVQVGNDFSVCCGNITRLVNKLAGIIRVNRLAVNFASGFLTRNDKVTATTNLFREETGSVSEFQFVRNKLGIRLFASFLGIFPPSQCNDFWFTRIVKSFIHLHGMFPDFHLVVKLVVNHIRTDKSVCNIACGSLVTLVSLQFIGCNCIACISGLFELVVTVERPVAERADALHLQTIVRSLQALEVLLFTLSNAEIVNHNFTERGWVYPVIVQVALSVTLHIRKNTDLGRVGFVGIVQSSFPYTLVNFAFWFGGRGRRQRSRSWDIVQIKVITHVITYC